MSADNTIVVLQNQGADGAPEFRVAHVQAAECLGDGDGINGFDAKFAHYAFGKSSVHTGLESAMQDAVMLLRSHGYVEYGIQVWDDFSEVPFPARPSDRCSA